MRLIIIIGLIILCNISIGQELITEIDTSNYYDYYVTLDNRDNLINKFVTTDWLRERDVVPVIMEELKKIGYKGLSEYTLFEIEKGKIVVLSVYSKKSKFGFFYFTGHGVPIKKEDRLDFTKQRGRDYRSTIETKTGESYVTVIKDFPTNIYILNENCYWFQYTKNEEDYKYLVSKERIIEILRQDIRNYLLNTPKP